MRARREAEFDDEDDDDEDDDHGADELTDIDREFLLAEAMHTGMDTGTDMDTENARARRQWQLGQEAARFAARQADLLLGPLHQQSRTDDAATFGAEKSSVVGAKAVVGAKVSAESSAGRV